MHLLHMRALHLSHSIGVLGTFEHETHRISDGIVLTNLSKLYPLDDLNPGVFLEWIKGNSMFSRPLNLFNIFIITKMKAVINQRYEEKLELFRLEILAICSTVLASSYDHYDLCYL